MAIGLLIVALSITSCILHLSEAVLDPYTPATGLDTSSRNDIIEQYFRLGFNQIENLAFLTCCHGVSLSLRQLKRILAKRGLRRRKSASDLSLVIAAIERELQGSGSNIGYRNMWQRLVNDHHLVVNKETVRHALRLIDPDGIDRRLRHRLQRRQYVSKGPNYIWHVDGYDKLKPYGFCIHGCIDGFSRLIRAIYLLHEVLPFLAHLSRAFQKGTVSFAAIHPAIQFTLDDLEAVSNEQTPLKSLKKDLLEGSRLSSCDLGPMTNFQEKQLVSLTNQYVAALRDNINNRFDGSVPVLTAFKIFDPLAVPQKSETTFKEYGLKEVAILTDHFYQEMEDDVKDERKEELICEWKKFKYSLLDLKENITPEILRPEVGKKLTTQTPTEWILVYLMRMRPSLKHIFPQLLEMAELCLSIPVSSAWPEKAASCVKRIKTRLRSNLKNEMLESLMHIAINGPEVKESKSLIESTLKEWLSQPRRKMTSTAQHSKAKEKATLVDASVQVGSSLHEEIQARNAILVEQRSLWKEIDMLQREMDEAAALFKLPEIDECFSDSDESDFYSDSDSE